MNKIQLMMQAVNDLRGDLGFWPVSSKLRIEADGFKVCNTEEFNELIRELSEDWQPTLQPTNN